MKYYAGLDVSLKESHLCIVDEAGTVVKEAVVASDPDALFCYLNSLEVELERLGLEACPLRDLRWSAWRPVS